MINLRRLRGLRVEHDLTQEEFASWIGMPISTYRKKELGLSPLQLEEAYKILRKCLHDQNLLIE